MSNMQGAAKSIQLSTLPSIKGGYASSKVVVISVGTWCNFDKIEMSRLVSRAPTKVRCSNYHTKNYASEQREAKCLQSPH